MHMRFSAELSREQNSHKKINHKLGRDFLQPLFHCGLVQEKRKLEDNQCFFIQK